MASASKRSAVLLLLGLAGVVGAGPAQAMGEGPGATSPRSVTSHRLAGAIDLYLKEVEAAEKAKAAAGEKLVATYEATIKRAMRAGELKTVEALQAELKDVRGEVEKGSQPSLAALRADVVGPRWFAYWGDQRNMDRPFVLGADGTIIVQNPRTDWKPKGWSIELRPVLCLGANVLLLLPNGELRGCFLGTGQPVGAFRETGRVLSPAELQEAIERIR